MSADKPRPKGDELNEILTKETIPPEALEVSLDNGKLWKNLITGKPVKTEQQLTEFFNRAKKSADISSKIREAKTAAKIKEAKAESTGDPVSRKTETPETGAGRKDSNTAQTPPRKVPIAGADVPAKKNPDAPDPVTVSEGKKQPVKQTTKSQESSVDSGSKAATSDTSLSRVKLTEDELKVKTSLKKDLDSVIKSDKEASKLWAKFRKNPRFVNFVEGIQDSWVRVKRLMEKEGVVFDDDSNPYLKETLFHGRVNTLLDDTRTLIDTNEKTFKAGEKRLGLEKGIEAITEIVDTARKGLIRITGSSGIFAKGDTIFYHEIKYGENGEVVFFYNAEMPAPKNNDTIKIYRSDGSFYNTYPSGWKKIRE